MIFHNRDYFFYLKKMLNTLPVSFLDWKGLWIVHLDEVTAPKLHVRPYLIMLSPWPSTFRPQNFRNAALFPNKSFVAGNCLCFYHFSTIWNNYTLENLAGTFWNHTSFYMYTELVFMPKKLLSSNCHLYFTPPPKPWGMRGRKDKGWTC